MSGWQNLTWNGRKRSVIVICFRSLTLRHKLVCGVHNARLALICAVRWRGDGFVAGMRRRDMSANDYTIAESECRIGVEKIQETTS